MINMKEIFEEHQSVIQSLHEFIPQIEALAEKIVTAIKNGGTVFWMGNGGSASDAQHMAAELIGRFKKDRKAMASISLTTDTSILTSISNDYGFNYIFAKQLEGLCKSQDIVIGLSTSGNSENVIKGIEVAKEKGAYTIAFTGQSGGKLKSMVNHCFAIHSNNTPRVQEATTLLCHCLCELIENIMISH